MKTVTEAFKNAQNSVAPVVVREVYYKRRYWDESTKHFIWEASWTEIPQSQVQSLSAVSWQLDSERLSEFKVSNVTLSLTNEQNQWLAGNYSGKFRGDDISPVGYEAYWTKFQIRAGFELADGSTETVAIFTGLATDWIPDSDSGYVRANLQGLEALLLNANAENASTRVDEEVLTGTVNGSNPDFATANNGTGLVHYVSDNGQTLRQGAEYDVSQLNDKNLPAKVTFTAPPLTGHTIRGSYTYWHQDTPVTDLIEDLLLEAGIPIANQDVEDVVVASIAAEQLEISTQAQWEAGTFTDLEAATSPGDLTFDYASSSFRTLLNDFNDGTTGGWSVFQGTVANSSNKLRVTSTESGLNRFSGVATKPSNRAAGTFEAKITKSTTLRDTQFVFMAQSVTQLILSSAPNTLYSLKVLNGYSLRISDFSITLFRFDSAGNFTTLSAASVSPGTSEHTYTIIRHPSSGKIDVYYDGSLKITAYDTTFNSSAVMAFETSAVLGGGNYSDIDDVYYAPDSVTGTWESATQDATSAIQAWGILDATNTLPANAAIIFQTKSSTDGISFESYVSGVAGYRINSGVKRYLKIKVTMTAPTDGTVPIISAITAQYHVSDVFKNTSLANYTGQTVYQAIQNYSRFADYEFGFSPDEVFFFRSRRTGTSPHLTLRQDVNVIRIASVNNGYDRVYSEVQATYGSYSKTIRADEDSRESPKLRFGSRRLSVEGSNILIDEDDDVATGIATALFNRYKRPKRRLKLQTTILPQLDLSDVVSLTYDDVASPPNWFWGDESVHWGQEGIHWYGRGQQLAHNTICKVIGIRIDTENWNCELDLEEILT